MTKPFYITTPIYYPNGEPHLGSLYCTTAVDIIARFHRLRGDDTFFLTGTDEHGVKMVKTAAALGKEPGDLADEMVAIFESFWAETSIRYDDFIRTTSPRHKSAVAEIVRQMTASGDIYLGSYAGWYDEGQEEFVTETEAKSHEYKSAISGKALTRYAEPSYFFKLSKYAPQVLAYIDANPKFVQPDFRRNEVLSKLREGLEDLSISRATLKWGIPMPQDPQHVLYVWIDALSNYITALGYGSADRQRFDRYWPASLHVIGKEILWFHAVYWPAMLLSLGLALPKQIFAHGWWVSGGRKMSKSLGNVIDIEKLRHYIRVYSLDALRYYLFRAAPFGSDLDFTDTDFTRAFNELKNVLGNGLNRTIKMIGKYRQGILPARGELTQIDRDLLARIESLPGDMEQAYEKLELQQAAMLPIELARAMNGYIDATEPFKLAKKPEDAARLDTVLNLSATAIYHALVALLPVLPTKAEIGLSQLGVSITGKKLSDLHGSAIAAGAKLGEGTALFPAVEIPAPAPGVK